MVRSNFTKLNGNRRAGNVSLGKVLFTVIAPVYKYRLNNLRTACIDNLLGVCFICGNSGNVGYGKSSALPEIIWKITA